MSKTNKIRLTFLSIIFITIITSLIVYPKVPDWVPQNDFFNKFKIHLGLDLQGGAHLVYEADFSNIEVKDEKSALEGVRDVIEKRVNTFGVAEPLVQVVGNNRIIVELAGVFDIQEAISQIGDTPLLEFKEMTEITYSDEEKEEITKKNQTQLIKASEISQRIQDGEDFSTLARENSEDPGSKENDGIIDFAKKELLDPAYAEVIFDKLANDEIHSEIVESQFGYHIIKKLEERGEDDEREVKSQHILFIKADALNPQTEWQNTKLSGKNLKESNVLFDQTTGNVQVGLSFDDEGKDLFAEITERNIGQPVGIFLDGDPITIPTVNEKIKDGSAVITGDFNLIEAKKMSQRLNAGALPVPINLISQQTVGASLGQESLDKSLKAGLIGLIILALFMI
ncbi:peptidylprolyl isomerase, partial [bacterium]|nr:peptidylprolyl isomerase [bacterium]